MKKVEGHCPEQCSRAWCRGRLQQVTERIEHHLAAGGVFSGLNGLAYDGHHLWRQCDADLFDIRHGDSLRDLVGIFLTVGRSGHKSKAGSRKNPEGSSTDKCGWGSFEGRLRR